MGKRAQGAERGFNCDKCLVSLAYYVEDLEACFYVGVVVVPLSR